MLRTVNPQRTLWESILPPECLRLPNELAAVDALLDDPAFFAPFERHFHARLGRPSIPIETYLRLMFLKFRHRLGFESLCREVSDSISWQRFCRIPLGETVPHPTTLMKLSTRCGPDVVEALNTALLQRASEERVLKTNRVRVDSTVVEANVAYPTESGLLAKGVVKMAKAVRVIKDAGLAKRTPTRDRTRQVHQRSRDIAANLRRRSGDAKDVVAKINATLAAIARSAITEARAVVRNARRSTRGGPRLDVVVADLERTAERVETIANQLATRLSGATPAGATRLVSLHDIDARPIRKGRIGKPVEFGYKAQVVDNEDGIVLDHHVEIGNPNDITQIVPAIDRITRRVGRPPRAVTADRGYSDDRVESELEALGVRSVVIPTNGRATAARRTFERRRSFRRLVKWRTGCEGRINCLKRDFGWSRTHMDGIEGARTWCGYGVFSHNLVKIAGLLNKS